MREMTDRPSFPLTEEAYREIVDTTEFYSEPMPISTEQYMMNNREVITELVFSMSTKAACEVYWNNDIRAWTDEGRIAIKQVIDTIALCVKASLKVMTGQYAPIGSTDIFRALVRKQYNAWRPPSETYLCM